MAAQGDVIDPLLHEYIAGDWLGGVGLVTRPVLKRGSWGAPPVKGGVKVGTGLHCATGQLEEGPLTQIIGLALHGGGGFHEVTFVD